MKTKALMILVLLFFSSCTKDKEKWSDIFLDERKSSYKNDYCEYNNLYIEKPVLTTYEGKRVSIIGVSSRTCKDRVNGLVVIDRYYALINSGSREEKLRIVFPAYMSLSTGDESFYKKFREEKHSLSSRISKD